MSNHKIPVRFREEVRILLHWIYKRMKVHGMDPRRSYPVGWFIPDPMDGIMKEFRFSLDKCIGGDRCGAARTVVLIEDKLCASLTAHALRLLGTTKVARYDRFLLTFHAPNDPLNWKDIWEPKCGAQLDIMVGVAGQAFREAIGQKPAVRDLLDACNTRINSLNSELGKHITMADAYDAAYPGWTRRRRPLSRVSSTRRSRKDKKDEQAEQDLEEEMQEEMQEKMEEEEEIEEEDIEEEEEEQEMEDDYH